MDGGQSELKTFKFIKKVAKIPILTLSFWSGFSEGAKLTAPES